VLPLPKSANRRHRDQSFVVACMGGSSSESDHPIGEFCPGTYVPVEEPPTASEPEVTALLNHRVGTLQKGFRDLEVKRLRGLEVDHELEFRRLLDGQIRWFFTLQDLCNKVGRPPK
jgi:hypothetical protein